LEYCLAAVTLLDPPAAEVIVVDSNSRTGDAIREVSLRNGAHYLRLERPGVSLAKNFGAIQATGDIVAFLDDDAIPSSSWLEHLVQPYRDPRVGCVTGTITPHPDFPDCGEYELLGYVRGPNSPVSISMEDSNWFQAACFGGIGISPNLSIRRSIYAKWSGFCERLGSGTPIVGNEEGHAFLDIVRLGYSIQYAPEALVFHPVPPPARETLRRRYYQNLSAATAFLLMLIIEERDCRWPALKYIFGKFRRVSSLWSRGTKSQQSKLAPRWRVALARACGAWCYLRSLADLASDKLKRNTRQTSRKGSQSLVSERKEGSNHGLRR
jgi:cellulose synthase/poly-beta-1,6-N-acetylglucosamine synthase-like glycosyltransferase